MPLGQMFLLSPEDPGALLQDDGHQSFVYSDHFANCVYIYSVRNCLYSDAEKLDLRATCNSARYDTEADESIVQAAILRLRGMLCVNCSWMLQL